MKVFDEIGSGSHRIANTLRENAEWHIAEPADRWFEAYQRFIKQTPMAVARQVYRWRTDSIAGLLHRLRSRPFPSGDEAIGAQEIVIWEFPLGRSQTPHPLDLVVAVRECRPRAIQVAHLRPGLVTTNERLVLQEAGVSLLLEDLWSLERLMRAGVT
jgi:hypothetical protein